ncbi:hypothetical protein DPEC_G00310990 [Dallia pectoralis]|uniref:Uncharacterized protein n=1 Tax=Dallia pectoralis TaxID=75939 RepID=A0ACC2FB92_DALPE|nr:hypothetical protein DPEC_G00310990 [Dallia pectoralis]
MRRRRQQERRELVAREGLERRGRKRGRRRQRPPPAKAQPAATVQQGRDKEEAEPQEQEKTAGSQEVTTATEESEARGVEEMEVAKETKPEEEPAEEGGALEKALAGLRKLSEGMVAVEATNMKEPPGFDRPIGKEVPKKKLAVLAPRRKGARRGVGVGTSKPHVVTRAEPGSGGGEGAGGSTARVFGLAARGFEFEMGVGTVTPTASQGTERAFAEGGTEELEEGSLR